MSIILPALHKCYPGNLAFTLDTGEVPISDQGYACLIGPNGSGKSSFAACLAAQDRSPSWFYVPQYLERFLYAGNLSDQLHELFAQTLDLERMLKLLEELGFVETEQLLDFPFLLMSGGERRRVALACALYVEPPFLILDEPDIGVAAKESIAILRKINNLRASHTQLLLISHNPAYVKGATDLICLKAGRIDRMGKTQELFSDPDFDLTNYGVRLQ